MAAELGNLDDMVAASGLAVSRMMGMLRRPGMSPRPQSQQSGGHPFGCPCAFCKLGRHRRARDVPIARADVLLADQLPRMAKDSPDKIMILQASVALPLPLLLLRLVSGGVARRCWSHPVANAEIGMPR